MLRLLVSFRFLIGLGMATLFLTGPVAAWAAHNLAHASASVAAGAYHYHEVGGVVVPHHKAGDPDDPDEEKGGHDHFLSLLLAAAAILPDASLVHPPVSTPVPAYAEVRALRLGTADPPLPRPPSSA